MKLNIGDTVLLPSTQKARIIALIRLFGFEYVDLYIEPSGPIRRVPISELKVTSEVVEGSAQNNSAPAPLFLSTITAHHLKALLTQQGLLSAANFRITPLPHQILAVDFVLGKFRPRAIIAEEVGLGKTIEAAMIYEELKLRHQAKRVLIITPAGLTRQWQDELKQKFSESFALMDRTLFSAMREIHGQDANLWLQSERVITSLDFIKPQKVSPLLNPRERQRRESHNREVFENLIAANWDMVIIDEAHKLSKEVDGSETARYKIGEALAAAVPVFLLLTATPHQGKPGKFLHLLNLVDPYGFTRVEDLHPDKVREVVWRTSKRAAVDGQKKPLFKQRITDIYPVDPSRPEFELERKLYDEVSAYVSDNYNRALGRNDRAFTFLMILFQRMLTSSTQAIADSLDKRLKKLSGWQENLEKSDANGSSNGDFDEEKAEDEDAQELLNELIDVTGVVNNLELGREIEILKRLLDLARRVLKGSDSKMVALLDIIDEIRRREGPTTKFLVFTEFVSTQTVLRKMLEGLGYKLVCINGGMNMDERIIARQEFSADAQFMISTDAGGEGVNLQFCHVMVNYDLPWNPAKLEQRIGRLDRIGQEHNVLVINLLTQGTVEQRVREVLESKLAIIRKQYGEDKLADILSTLQEEFRFDKLFIEALAKREAEAVELESIGDQIYNRARQILDQDDLLLPHAQAEIDQYQKRLVEIAPNQIRSLLTGYLLAHGEKLTEYSRRQGVFYFDLPKADGSKEHYGEVVFDRDSAIKDDGVTFLHLNHPIIEQLLEQLTRESNPLAAQMRLRPDSPQGKLITRGAQGIWAVYVLQATNHTDVNRQELVPVYIDNVGVSQPRLAQSLLSLTPEQVDTAFVPLDPNEVTRIKDMAWKIAESQASDRFSEIQLEHAEQTSAEQKKVEQYYRQQEGAVRQIAIENIRLAKQRELLERRRADIDTLQKRIQLVPDLKLIGLAYIYN